MAANAPRPPRTYLGWNNFVGSAESRRLHQSLQRRNVRVSRDGEQVRRFRGHIKELLMPAHESQWRNADSSVVVLHNQLTRDVKCEPYREVEVRGRLGLFDRYLIYDVLLLCKNYEVRPVCKSGEVMQWASLPERLPFSVSLFSNMVFCYDTEVDDEHQAAAKGVELLYTIDVESKVPALKLLTNIDTIARMDYVHETLSARTVYFYLEHFLALGAVYPNGHEAVRAMPYLDRLDIFAMLQSTPELLCYTSTARLHTNPLGLLSAQSIYRILRSCPNTQRSAALATKFRVFTYQDVIAPRWVDHPYNRQSTRVHLTAQEERSLRHNKQYHKLFEELKVLRIIKLPVSPQEPDRMLTYLARPNANVRAYRIIEGLRNLLGRRNMMPPVAVMQRLRSRDGDTDNAPWSDGEDDFGMPWSDDDDNDGDDEAKNQNPWADFPIPGTRHVHAVCAGLSEEQSGAVRGCVHSPLHMLTGGAGVGKTRTLRSIWLLRPREYVIATPTGKACDRVVESLSEGAALPCAPNVVTVDYINTLLAHNADHPMRYITALIIDEASCVSEPMLASLLERLPYLQQLVLVGDVNQLGPIDPGFPFRDMLDHVGGGRTTRLTKNFRAQDDDLAHNAQCIIDNRLNDMHFYDHYETAFLPAYTFVRRTRDLERDLLRAYEYLTTVSGDSRLEVERNTQIIAVSNLTCRDANSIIYNYRFNDSSDSKSNPDGKFYHVGQRIMFLKNFRETKEEGGTSSAVRNGATGTITRIYDVKTRSCTVKTAPDVEELEHTHYNRFPSCGYRRWMDVRSTNGAVKSVDLAAIKNTVVDGSCQTGHKSQGSEYRYVILLMNRPRPGGAHIVNTNWTYTVCTRPTRALIVLYQPCTVVDRFCSAKIQQLGSWAASATTPRPNIDTFLWLELAKLDD